MTSYWDSVFDRLRTYPPTMHRLRPPCPPERIRAVQGELGALPAVLTEMLGHFNGAELFFIGMPFITVFGISEIPPLSPLQWAPDWYVDRFTPAWRKASVGRNEDWVIGMKNYGALAVLENDNVREWDTARMCWDGPAITFKEWFKMVIDQGEVMLHEVDE